MALELKHRPPSKESKSLIQAGKYCYICGTEDALHKHHIFYGTANRKIADQDGCWCWLCAFHHNMSNVGVHFNKRLDLVLKRTCQKAYQEAFNASNEDFIARYGKSYL